MATFPNDRQVDLTSHHTLVLWYLFLVTKATLEIAGHCHWMSQSLFEISIITSLKPKKNNLSQLKDISLFLSPYSRHYFQECVVMVGESVLTVGTYSRASSWTSSGKLTLNIQWLSMTMNNSTLIIYDLTLSIINVAIITVSVPFFRHLAMEHEVVMELLERDLLHINTDDEDFSEWEEGSN